MKMLQSAAVGSRRRYLREQDEHMAMIAKALGDPTGTSRVGQARAQRPTPMSALPPRPPTPLRPKGALTPTGAQKPLTPEKPIAPTVSKSALRRRGRFQRLRPSTVVKKAPLKTSVNERDAKRLVGRHGLTGPLPSGLGREQRMAAYEARYVSAGGHKAERWQRRALRADKVKNVGLGVATAGGAAWLAGRTHAGAATLRRLGPRAAHHAETAAGAGAVVGGAGELYAGHSRRKRSSYASAPAGVAASALRRMRDYTPNNGG